MMALTQATLTERKVVTELLQLYKQYPCLWNSSHALYGNSEARKQALTVMLDTYKHVVVDATMDTLKKKIDNLRCAYKREFRKVLNNKRHSPSLWYYNLMTFLDEGAIVAEYLPENEDENENPDIKVESFQPEESTYTIKTETMSETDAFGRVLGLQLSELSPMQKTIAEKLISDIVYYARMDKLTTKTNLINLNDDFL